MTTDGSPVVQDDSDPHPMPPIFVTLKDILECDPGGEFPQRTALPFFAEASQVQFSCEYYDPDHVAWVMYIFHEEWEKAFGDHDRTVRGVLNTLEIQWGNETRVEHRIYSINGTFLESAEVSGLMLSPTSAWVSIEESLSQTSLIHELVHIALEASCGDADADHEGNVHPCWAAEHTLFITRVNDLLSTKYSL